MALEEAPARTDLAKGDVRREVGRVAGQLGFARHAIAELEIVGTELAGNLVQHKTLDGTVLVSAFGGNEGIEIVSVDRGPGIDDVEAALADHYSTSGSLGCGLGAVRRLMHEFDIYSEPSCPHGSDGGNGLTGGTIVVARRWVTNPTPRRFLWGAVSKPCEGETANGDAVFASEDERGLLVAVADGLGHGPKAEEASRTCMAYILRNRGKEIETLLAELHEGLRGTNGVALTLVRILPDEGRLVHCGIGNVYARCYPRTGSSPVPKPGILGSGRAPKPRVQEMPWSRDATLLIYTDGISERWSLDETPELGRRDVSTISHYLAQRYARPLDDATIVTIREASG